jgi:hypothetical protein
LTSWVDSPETCADVEDALRRKGSSLFFLVDYCGRAQIRVALVGSAGTGTGTGTDVNQTQIMQPKCAGPILRSPGTSKTTLAVGGSKEITDAVL